MDTISINILYASETGKSHKLACDLSSRLCIPHHIKCFDDHYLTNAKQLLIIITSTYFNGKPPTNGKVLFDQLKDLYNDFRIERNYLKETIFSVFGLGNKAYEKDFCLVARDMRYMLKKLGAKEAVRSVYADEYSCLEENYVFWSKKIVDLFLTKNRWTDFIDSILVFDSTSKLVTSNSSYLNAKNVESGNSSEKNVDTTPILIKPAFVSKPNSDLEAMDKVSSETFLDCNCVQSKKLDFLPFKTTNFKENTCRGTILEKRDIMKKKLNDPTYKNEIDKTSDQNLVDNKKVDFEQYQTDQMQDSDSSSNETAFLTDIEDIGKKMLTPILSKNLQKQGYHLVGSHSAVKLCRWTKSMLRGHGGCYKHTFYGIASLSCMEATPSLACANKCVFCWRHYTNPVSKKWMWESDDPNIIFQGLIDGHQSFIKQLKYSPGVTPEALERAMNISHCALSLVGEPIMYPYISQLLDILHENKISTFLVTNAQFPELLESMNSATQLYLSIDAANRDDLKKIDRPLHKDYWQRLLKCVDIVKNRKERTVFRLTLVKNKNNRDFDGYRELISRGMPDFVEVKGVTFCGYKNKSEMSLLNVPFHIEVVEFCKNIVIEGYEIACVHEHSCCVLIAHTKFKVDGVWNTWIDYPKFFSILKTKEFSAINYSTLTPPWSLFESIEKGFDPKLTRKIRNKKIK